MYHYVEPTPSGAECSCGKQFNIWAYKVRPGWSASHNTQRTLNLAQANARRHAEAANRKEVTS